MAKKSKSKSKSKPKYSEARRKAVKEYQKERRRIRDIVKRAVSKGLKVVVEIPKKISIRSTASTVSIKAETRVLSEVTPRKLRAAGKLEREVKQSRKKQHRESKAVTDAYDSNEPGFLEEQERRDKETLSPARIHELVEKFNLGDITLTKIESMIDEFGQENPAATAHLKDILEREIMTYGRDKVAIALSEAPEDAIEAAQAVMTYNVGTGKHDRAITEMLTVIRGGEVPTAEELDELELALDMDYYFDTL